MALILVLVAGTLLQACSDNNATTGPTFACNETPLAQGNSGSTRALAACPTGTAGPVQVVGDANSGAVGAITVTVAVTPNSVDIGRRATVIVVATNKNGVRLAGTHKVIVTTSVGSIDGPEGELVDGVYRTTLSLPCGTVAPAGGGTVTAIVDGTASIVTGGSLRPGHARQQQPLRVGGDGAGRTPPPPPRAQGAGGGGASFRTSSSKRSR